MRAEDFVNRPKLRGELLAWLESELAIHQTVWGQVLLGTHKSAGAPNLYKLGSVGLTAVRMEIASCVGLQFGRELRRMRAAAKELRTATGAGVGADGGAGAASSRRGRTQVAHGCGREMGGACSCYSGGLGCGGAPGRWV